MRLWALILTSCLMSLSSYPQAASLSSSSVVDMKASLAVYFLHMRKCGGSSVGRYLRDWLTASGCCPSSAPCKTAPHWMASPNTVAGWRCRGTGGNATIHFREDEYHCLAGAFAQRMPSVVPAVHVLSVTVLRHPIDRILSQWWYHGGPGHRFLQELVAINCRSDVSNGTSASALATAATVANAAASAIGRSQFYGQAVVEQHKGAVCYQAAVKQARARSRTEGEGAAWWTETWLDKDPPRAHLFRSLHAQYLPNYAVHRLAAEPGGYERPQTEGNRATDASNTEEKEAAVVREGPESESGFDEAAKSAVAVEALAMLRKRCNLRGSKAIGASDFELALKSLKKFDVVLIMEWMDSSDSDREANGGASALISERAGSMVALLRDALGDLAPSTLGHARAGTASATLMPPHEERSQAAKTMVQVWHLEGRGDAWRRQHAPESVLERLADDNYFDLELYRAAGAMVQSRAQSAIGSSRGN